MCISTNKNKNGVVTINLGERFTFESQGDFLKAYREQPKETDYIINLKKTVYMDSSALGMLLSLREHTGTKNKIRITACSSKIYKVLEIARFSKIFQFDEKF